MLHRRGMYLLSLIGLLVPGTVGLAQAAGRDTWRVASALGDVLASEGPCGFRYDQDAIKAFIAKNVAADDMEFASTLAMVTRVQEQEISSLPPSSKTAQCEQTERVARSYGFIH